MRRLNAVMVSGGMVAGLLTLGCGQDEPLAGPNLAVQAAKPATGLKVTPATLEFSGTGMVATLTASSPNGPISVTVSDPACVSVTLKSAQAQQSRFTVTSTVAGECTLTVTDAGTGNVQVPVEVSGSQVLMPLAVGSAHTCGLDQAGTAWCWGNNGLGQLGNREGLGTGSANPTPLPVKGGLVFTAITAGLQHTCGLTPLGAVYCWGDNDRGQLGNSTNSGVSGAANWRPLLVQGNLTFSVIEAGGAHTCGITTQGLMYCWGANTAGQLGNGAADLLPNPMPVPVDGNLVFTALASGDEHTCGVTTGGLVYCWGLNMDGQLGFGPDNLTHATPVQVAGISLESLTAGQNHTCGISSAGTAWCWGDNRWGELSGTTEEDSPTPVEVAGLSFESLAAGSGFTCGVAAGGAVYCWGFNFFGQLGTSTNFETQIPNYTPAAVSGLSFAAVAAGHSHTCGVTPAGTAWCFGNNPAGQLGTTTNNGLSVGVPTPQLVSGGMVFATP